MAKIDLYKASAGAGKTYTLTRKYLSYLLQSDTPEAYRHILAVTFTNKATDEMKQRVLETLAEKSEEDSAEGRRAKAVLVKILHDYSNFAVTTIDKFFLQIIRAFSREIGQNGTYRVELDEASVIAAAVDAMLDSLDEEDNAALLEWMVAYALESVEKGGSYDIAKTLNGFGKLFLKEDFRIKKMNLGTSYIHDRAEVERVRQFTVQRMAGFRKQYPPRSRGVPEYAKRLNKTDEIICDSIGIMGISSDIYARMTDYLHQKNLILLSESKEIIRKLIDASDAPFIYEKVGNRYDHLMLDEFQDTSRVEWQNFLPLFRESLSKGEDCMIVGDIKQSIYRFRGSDWETLNSGVDAAFNGSIENNPLQVNYRSLHSIIDFNNDFYGRIGDWLPDEYSERLAAMYGDARQEYHKDGDGYVNITVNDNMPSGEFHDKALEWLGSAIDALQADGFPAGSITVLARTNHEIADIAQKLISEGRAVITDESLLVSGCQQVQKIMAVLKYISAGTDDICNEQLRQLGVDVDSLAAGEASLYDLCETIVRTWLGPIDKGDIPYINAFMDSVAEYAAVYGSDTAAFVRWWDETASGSKYISVPDGQDAVRVMTYHKSKGLSIDAVIIPFFDEPFAPRNNGENYLWVTPPGEICEMGLFPVKFNAKLKETLFAQEYARERFLTAVDSVNAAYVATTRARQAMYIFAHKSKDGIASMADCMASMLGQLHAPADECDSFSVYEFGRRQPYAAPSSPADSREQDPVETFISIPYLTAAESADGEELSPRLQMAFSGTAFFEEPDARQKGIVLHDILASVSVPEDIPQSVAGAVADGVLPADEASAVTELLSQALGSVAGYHWFDAGLEGYNELSIINTDGNVERPDRVVVREAETVVIDYKFGEERRSHARQVGRYMKLLRQMGYPGVKGYLWYVRENKVEKI